MKKILSFMLVLLMLFLSACSAEEGSLAKNDTSKQVSNSEVSSESVNDDKASLETSEDDKSETKNETSQNKPKEQETKKLTKKEAKKIADELITKSMWYGFSQTACDIEISNEDMSEFLTESQLEDYCYYQYKINCCSSVKEVRKHLLKYFHKSRIEYFSEEDFFKDDKGCLYVKGFPFGAYGYDEVVIVKYSNDEIVAKAVYKDVDGSSDGATKFIIKKVNGNFILM